MRTPEAKYSEDLNGPDADQESVARTVFEFVQALRQAAEDGKLTPAEIFQAAITHAPDAAMKILGMVRGGDPIQSDIEMTGHIITRQLGIYDAPRTPSRGWVGWVADDAAEDDDIDVPVKG